MGRKLFAALCVTLVLAGCDWSQTNFTAGQTRNNQFETELGPTNVSRLHQRWIRPEASQYAAPVVAGDTAYVATYELDYRLERLLAVSVDDGTIRWSAPMPGIGSIAVASGRVFATVGDRMLAAVDARSGAPLWQSATGSGSVRVIVAGDTVYVGMSAFVAATGVRLRTGSPPAGFELGFETGFGAVGDGAVYSPFQQPSEPGLGGVLTGKGAVVAADAKTGATRWTVPTLQPFTLGLAEANGRVYVASAGQSGSSLEALSAKTGARLWVSNGVTPAALGAPVAVGDREVYVASYPEVHALDAATGIVRWSTGVATCGSTNPFAANPTLANGVLYLSTGDGLCALDASTGHVLWSEISAAPSSPGTIVVSGGSLYSSTSTGLHALDAR